MAGAFVIAFIIVLGFLMFRSTTTFKIEKALLPTVWEYKGLYTTPEQVTKILDDIDGFKKRVGATTEEKYDLALTVAQAYMRIGEGKGAYEHLLRAAKIDPVNSVTYQSMGVLFESLKAYNAAEESFKKAIKTQPHIVQNHLSLINFYQRQNFDKETIDQAFTESLKTTNKNINILKEYAQWLEGEKRWTDALLAWQEVLDQNFEPAVEKKVMQLKAKTQ